MTSRLVRWTLYFLVVAGTSAYFAISAYSKKPRTLAAGEVPTAFWSWRTRTPAATDLDQAKAATGFTRLFLRAGQMDTTGWSFVVSPSSLVLRPSSLVRTGNGVDRVLRAMVRRRPAPK